MKKYLTRQSPGIHVRPHQCANKEYYHETNPKVGGDAYKLGAGKDLNNLLAIAEELMQNPDAPFDDDRTNCDMFASIHRVVDYIAHSEELEEEAEAVDNRLGSEEAVKARYVEPAGTFAPDAPERKKAYLAVLKRFGYPDDFGEYPADEKEIGRFCVVTPRMMAHPNVDNDTMEAARRHAFESLGDACSELPVVIVDLDTGEEWEPDLTTIQWRTVVKEENQ